MATARSRAFQRLLTFTNNRRVAGTFRATVLSKEPGSGRGACLSSTATGAPSVLDGDHNDVSQPPVNTLGRAVPTWYFHPDGTLACGLANEQPIASESPLQRQAPLEADNAGLNSQQQPAKLSTQPLAEPTNQLNDQKPVLNSQQQPAQLDYAKQRHAMELWNRELELHMQRDALDRLNGIGGAFGALALEQRTPEQQGQARSDDRTMEQETQAGLSPLERRAAASALEEEAAAGKLTEVLAKVEQQRGSLMKRIATLEAQPGLRPLEERIGVLEEQPWAVDLAERLDELEADRLDGLEADHSREDLLKRVAALEAQPVLTPLEERLEALEKQPCAGDLAERLDELEAADHSREDLLTRISAVEAQRSSLFGRVSWLEGQPNLSALEERIAELEDQPEAQDLASRLDDLEAEHSREDLLKRVSALEAQPDLTDLDERIDALEAQPVADDLAERLEKLESEHDRDWLLQRIDFLEEAFTPLKARISALEEHAAGSHSFSARLAQLEVSARDFDSLRKRAADLEARPAVSELQQQISRLEQPSPGAGLEARLRDLEADQADLDSLCRRMPVLDQAPSLDDAQAHLRMVQSRQPRQSDVGELAKQLEQLERSQADWAGLKARLVALARQQGDTAELGAQLQQLEASQPERDLLLARVSALEAQPSLGGVAARIDALKEGAQTWGLSGRIAEMESADDEALGMLEARIASVEMQRRSRLEGLQQRIAVLQGAGPTALATAAPLLDIAVGSLDRTDSCVEEATAQLNELEERVKGLEAAQQGGSSQHVQQAQREVTGLSARLVKMERQLRDLDDLTDEVNTTYKHILTPRVTILDRATQTLKTRLNKLSDDFEDFKTASSDADDWSDFCDSYANSFSAYDSGFDNEDAPSCQSK